MEEIINNLQNIDSPINLNFGITINPYLLSKDFNDLIKEYKNLTFVDIGECTKIILDHYKLKDRNQIYLIGYDTPSNDSLSSINNFNYEIYLFNGTQVDLSICQDIKIKISSPIKNPSSVRLDGAFNFFNQGYDIYNKSDNFYNDICSKISNDGYDIILSDRKKDFYPNISLCNDHCVYASVDYESERFICDCDIIEDKEEEEENVEENNDNFFEEEDFKSLELLFCYKPLFTFDGIKKNVGFYSLMIILLINMISVIKYNVKDSNFLNCLIYEIIYTRKNSISNQENIGTNLQRSDYLFKKIQTNELISNKEKNNPTKKNVNKIINIQNNILVTRDVSSFRKINQTRNKNIPNPIKKMSINETNSLSYKEALKCDRRKFFKIYIDYLIIKQAIIFTFFYNNDYNSKGSKISLFFMSFATSYSINTFFFNEEDNLFEKTNRTYKRKRN